MDIRIFPKCSMDLRSSSDDFAEIRRMNGGSAKVRRRIVEGRHLIIPIRNKTSDSVSILQHLMAKQKKIRRTPVFVKYFSIFAKTISDVCCSTKPQIPPEIKGMDAGRICQ